MAEAKLYSINPSVMPPQSDLTPQLELIRGVEWLLGEARSGKLQCLAFAGFGAHGELTLQVCGQGTDVAVQGAIARLQFKSLTGELFVERPFLQP